MSEAEIYRATVMVPVLVEVEAGSDITAKASAVSRCLRYVAKNSEFRPYLLRLDRKPSDKDAPASL